MEKNGRKKTLNFSFLLQSFTILQTFPHLLHQLEISQNRVRKTCRYKSSPIIHVAETRVRTTGSKKHLKESFWMRFNTVSCGLWDRWTVAAGMS